MSRGNLATLDTNEDEKTNGSSNSYTNGAEHSTLPRVLSRASLGAGRQQSESSIFSRKLPSSFKFSLPSKASMPSSMSDLSNKLKRTSSSSKQLSKNFQSTNFWSTIGSVIQAGGRLHHNTVGVLRHAVDKRLKTKKELEKYHLIHPEKAWKKRWDLFFAIAILITTGYIPFHIAYGKFIQNDYLSDTVFESLTVVIYSTNILIHFNTAQIDPVTGYLVARRITLANRYLAFEFWVDLVAAFPFDLIIQASLTAHNQQAGFVLPLLRIIRFIMVNCVYLYFVIDVF